MIGNLIKRLFLTGALLILNCAFGQQQEQSVVLRAHFAGMDSILASKEATHLSKVFSLNETEVLKGQVFKKLASAINTEFSLAADKNPEISTIIEPLLDDMLKREWYVLVATRNGAISEVFLGVLSSENKGTVWASNLVRAVETWSNSKVSSKKFNGSVGWEGKLPKSFNLIRFAQSGRWMFIGIATDKFGIYDEMLKRFQANNNLGMFSSNNWLEADVDLIWLSGAIKTPIGGAKNAFIAMSSRGGDVRSYITLRYSNPLKWKYRPWTPPKGIITDPLISFTAINGADSLLSEIEVIKKLNLKNVPDQLYMWAQGTIPFATFFAVPFNDSTNMMNNLAVKLPPLLIGTNGISRDGNIFWVSNKAEMVWQGLPLMTPFLRATADGGNKYILGGLFAAAQPGKTMAPAELWNQFMGRTNLMYYDWEYTQERLTQWMQIYQILPLFTKVPQVPESSLGQRWLQKVAVGLGDSATEILVKNSTEVQIVRRSSIGFVGFELLHLARWFDSPTFPYSALRADSKNSPSQRIPRK